MNLWIIEKILFKNIFLIFIASFFSSALVSYSHAGVILDRVVAVVDREAITWSDLYRSMEFDLAEQIRGLGPKERRELLQRHEKEYLEHLIDMRIQLKEARKLNIGVSKEEISYAIDQMRRKFNISLEEFEEALLREGLTLDKYKKKIAEQILLSKIVNHVIRSTLIITEAEIDTYIKNNPSITDLSEGYRIRQILIKAKNPEEKKRASGIVKHIVESLEKGESFASLARKYSEGPNADTGGSLGSIKKKDLAGNFVDVLESLTDGQYSSPFWSESGVHMLYLEEKITGNLLIRDRVKAILLEEKFNHDLKEWLRSLRSKVHIEVYI
jgi:peptidyl-prolyl cis-trans isomerase SurA